MIHNPGGMKNHPVVSHDAWLSARKVLLAKEKEHTRMRDELSRQRRALPWEKVDKLYSFEGPDGKLTLADLFEQRSQLIVYHFMFDPEWEEGCQSCSFWADSFSGSVVHLKQRDVTFVAISRAPYARIKAFKNRMGWSFTWVSSFHNDFNFDYQVSFTPEQVSSGVLYRNYEDNTREVGPEWPGISVFYRNEQDEIFHTYSCYARGIDAMNVTYQYLDLTPRGRDEDGPVWGMAWVRHHDKYED